MNDRDKIVTIYDMIMKYRGRGWYGEPEPETDREIEKQAEVIREIRYVIDPPVGKDGKRMK